MECFKKILVEHTVSADPSYCSMLDDKQIRRCKYELSSACALFKRALISNNFWNLKCTECLQAKGVEGSE